MVTFDGSPPNRADVVLDPLQSGDHVCKRVVARRPAVLLRQVGCGEEPEHTRAVVDGDQYDPLERQKVAVVSRLVTSPAREAAAVDPEHDGQFTVAPAVAGAYTFRYRQSSLPPLS